MKKSGNKMGGGGNKGKMKGSGGSKKTGKRP